VQTPVGDVRAIRSAVEPVGEVPMAPVPALGAHTDTVLAELGYSADEVEHLRANRIVV
jgi:crotonobetainyl-CoA:carnitine CoA-transferase CaiB-like acyl-CoA transferase